MLLGLKNRIGLFKKAGVQRTDGDLDMNIYSFVRGIDGT